MTRALFAAIGDGDVETARRILTEEPTQATTRDENGVSALLFALYHRAREIADLILATGPPLDLFEAAATGRVERVTELLGPDEVDVNAKAGDGFTALHLACFFGQSEAADALLESGADPSAAAANPSQVQPLHSAAAGRSPEIVELLLRRGASVNARQLGGWTALHAAVQHDDERMAHLLLEHGADPNQAADDGRTAIDMAREQGASSTLARLEGR